MKIEYRKFATVCSLLGSISACTSIPSTVERDANVPYVELNGYKYHVQTFGDRNHPVVIVVHGGPGGDSKYLYPINNLANDYFVVYYDQRGTGLSPRVDKKSLTLESSLDDLNDIVGYYSDKGPVKLIGHSWGGMLVVGYLGQHPERVSHAVVVEPGILTPDSAKEFVGRLKASQSFWDALVLVKYVLLSPFVSSADGHERFDYVMTKIMNRSKPGPPYQCEGQAMPPDSFTRAGYEAFDNMLKPVLDHPERFTRDLTANIAAYQGKLLMISSECSFIGYQYQQQYHIPLLPTQTVHIEAKNMGHNMLSLNAQWSQKIIREFFSK